jgi:hypothetical protein
MTDRLDTAGSAVTPTRLLWRGLVCYALLCFLVVTANRAPGRLDVLFAVACLGLPLLGGGRGTLQVTLVLRPSAW